MCIATPLLKDGFKTVINSEYVLLQHAVCVLIYQYL